MKVIAVIGSPRKGNSYKITQRIEEKFKKFGDIEFDYIF
jgi:multimeric flavodoxin WrbA